MNDRTAKRKLTKEQRRMERAVKYITKYVSSYARQPGYLDYHEGTYIDDILYGLGASLGEEFQFAQGFDAFKKKLREHLG